MKKKRNIFTQILSIIGKIIIILVILIALALLFLTIKEYKPEESEHVQINAGGTKTLMQGSTISILTWNTGYGALGNNADFFMDGGTQVKTADKKRVEWNLDGIVSTVSVNNPDIVFFQEVDRKADRSFKINQEKYFAQSFTDYDSMFANNFKVSFVPYPIPPIGQVDAGIMTLSAFPVTDSIRIQLPCPFSWPMRTCNLKRCLMISRIPIDDSKKQLVLVNLHLEAYDSGEGKKAQTKMLKDLLQTEYEKGNYVIAGGDFNQVFSSMENAFPTYENMWKPGLIDEDNFEEGWQFEMDNEVPSCRSLDKAYIDADKDNFQYYLIDGFIISANLQLEYLETMDAGFIYTDHNPVYMRVSLLE